AVPGQDHPRPAAGAAVPGGRGHVGREVADSAPGGAARGPAARAGADGIPRDERPGADGAGDRDGDGIPAEALATHTIDERDGAGARPAAAGAGPDQPSGGFTGE